MLMSESKTTSAVQTSEDKDVSRRRFFKVLGGASTVALAAPIMSGDAHAGESKNEARKSRYRETDHVKKFYSTNRY